MCDQCEVLMIQGVKCHEHGCPNAWKDEIRECDWCGCDFTPEKQYDYVCSDSCLEAYHN